ncbi:MAG: Hsp20/alpha crystallin family protein [Haloarculaceae archaeon]
MSRGNPFAEIQRLFDRASRQFDDASRAWETDGPTGWLGPGSRLSVDLVERDDEYVVTADLPGFDREAVDVRITDRTLHVAAEREPAVAAEDGTYLRRERRHGPRRRALRLPDEVDLDGVAATMENGVLRVVLARREVEEARQISIE